MDSNRDYKIDYLGTINESIRKKHYESYVINALWFWIDNPNIRFVTQQYIQRQDDKNNALIDLYLPQLNIAIEIDESQHIASQKEDKAREEEIKQVLPGVDIIRIPVYSIETSRMLTIEELNTNIKGVAAQIKEKINELGVNFNPWRGEDEFLVANIKKQGKLICKGYNQICVNTIDDAFELFGAKPKHRGYLRAAGADDPKHPNQLIWCPNVKSKQWVNEVNLDETIIEEYPVNKEAKKHLTSTIASGKMTRIVFLKSKDMLGNKKYRFVGVFELDEKESNAKGHCVWKKNNLDEYYL